MASRVRLAVARRDVLRGAAVAAGAGVVGYALATTSDLDDPATATTAANEYGVNDAADELLAAVDDIPLDGGLVLGGAAVVLVRDAAGVRAFSAICTHQGCRVTSVSDGAVRCPCHGSAFDAATGAVVAGP